MQPIRFLPYHNSAAPKDTLDLRHFGINPQTGKRGKDDVLAHILTHTQRPLWVVISMLQLEHSSGNHFCQLLKQDVGFHIAGGSKDLLTAWLITTGVTTERASELFYRS